ncbi:hypothetical protein ACBI99_17825 [Nonomuraea sp. ATR24]|uniref:hypothetical protein n=1 Tax=Nonomuraea sp. ATR24 TaxID=1676744 RepID=UPI0035BFD75E
MGGASAWLLLDAETTPATRAALTYGEASARQQIVIDRDSGQLLAIQESDGSSAYLAKRLGWTDDPAPKESTFS